MTDDLASYIYIYIYIYIGTHDLASVEAYDAGADKWVPVAVCTF
jgi:hypothetical protein